MISRYLLHKGYNVYASISTKGSVQQSAEEDLHMLCVYDITQSIALP